MLRCRIFVALLSVSCLLGADWPRFRGPRGDGISEDTGFPITWSETENVVWKAQLPGPGASSPIVVGDQVLVTCYSGYGDGKGKEMAALRRHLVCLERSTGKTLWQSEVAAKVPEIDWGGPISQHGYTTSTPLCDGTRIYAQYGKTGVFAYDRQGKELWKAETGSLINGFGSGASPILVGDLLIVNATVEWSRLVALDRATGKVVWRQRINGDCWTTPLLVELPGGKKELVLFARGLVLGFDPTTGEPLWECECLGPDYVSASPLVRDGVIFVSGSGNAGRPVKAIRAGGRGDVTKTHTLWTQKMGASFTSPLLLGPNLFSFGGQALAIKAATGDVVFQERLAGLGTEYGSPVAAEGRIYLFTRRGECHVLEVGDKLKSLARNELKAPAGFTGSPALSNGRIYVRSAEHLYCLGTK